MRAISLCTFLVLASCEEPASAPEDTGTDDDTGTLGAGEDTDTEVDEPTPVPAAEGDTCAEADLLGTGTWSLTGTLADLAGDYDGVCPIGAAGPDAAIRVRQEPGEYLYARYALADGDGVLYVLDACASESCGPWSDAAGVWTEEIVVPPADLARDQAVILDAKDTSAQGAFTAVLEIGVPGVLRDNPTCLGAPGRDGVHVVDLAAGTDDADLAGATASCTGFSQSAGTDTFVPVDVPPGETLSATWTAEGADGVIYLLSECGEVESCVAGSDRTAYGDPESLRWVNDTGEPRRMTLVLDTFASGSGHQGGLLSLHVY